MRKQFAKLAVIAACIFFTACGGGKDTPSSIAQKWCDLNSKVYKAENDAVKDAAKIVRDKFEKDMEEKYKDDKAFMEEIGKEVEKCEDASEGR